jgi:hypothetical protein
LQAQVAEIRAERDETVTWLREQGFTVADTDANFALFGPFEDRQAVFEALLERGVLIRVTGPEGWLRVSIGTSRAVAAMTPFDLRARFLVGYERIQDWWYENMNSEAPPLPEAGDPIQ